MTSQASAVHSGWSARQILVGSLSLLIGFLLLVAFLSLYLLVSKDLERRSHMQMEDQLLEHWRPKLERPRPGPRLGDPGDPGGKPSDRPPSVPLPGGTPGDRPPSVPLPGGNPGHRPGKMWRIHLVLDSQSQPKWTELPSNFILVRYYDLKLRLRFAGGGPPRGPVSDLAELAKGRSEPHHYRSKTHFENWLMWVQPIHDPQGHPVGVLEMGIGLRAQEDLLRDLVGGLVLAGGLSWLLGVALLLAVSGYIAPPLQEMLDAMERVSAGDFSVRAPIRGSREVRAISSHFNLMVERLNQAFQAQEQFLADASHELKTPLTSITTMTELLADNYDQLKPERRERAWQVVARELARMRSLVQDLLEVSRLTQGREEAEEVNWYGLLHSLQEEFPQLQLECRQELTGFVFDPSGARRSLRNLLENAHLHSQPDKPIRVEVESRAEQVHLRIIDQGSGIPAADLPHITKRFYRSDLSRSRLSGGTGLGLAMVAAWVERNGGQLTIKSELNQGTEVEICLPNNPQKLPS